MNDDDSGVFQDYESDDTPPMKSVDLVIQFIEGNRDTAAIDNKTLGEPASNVYARLRSYITRHKCPINIRMKNGQVILTKVQ